MFSMDCFTFKYLKGGIYDLTLPTFAPKHESPQGFTKSSSLHNHGHPSGLWNETLGY